MSDSQHRSDLVARIRRLEAEAEILRTLHAYASAHYNGDLALYLSCFTEDGEQLHEPGGGAVRGHAELAAKFVGNQHAPESYHKVVPVEPLIELDGTSATVESDWLLVQDAGTGPYISHFGHYSDKLVEGADGRWRLTSRRVTREAMAPGAVSISRPAN